MSAATTPNTTTTNGAPVSAVDYVRALSPEEKQAVFLALLREALAENGDTGLLPVDDEDGKPFGYYVPPKAAAAYLKVTPPALSSDQEEGIRRAIATPHATFDMGQFLDDLSREDRG
jgi:hypothetical protein